MSKITSIYEITPFTLTDYPGKLSCILWFAGCNMRCVYCYNKEIVLSKGKIENEFLKDFLTSRIDKLDAVVLSGGECTNSTDFLYILKLCKKLGFLTKIDTNGSNINIIKKAIESNLIDYIALDFKALRETFGLVTNTNFYDKFISTLKYLISINFNFEVRTTVHKDFIDENDISLMAQILEKNGYKNDYFLQNFLSTGENFGCIDEPISSFNPEKIKSNISIKLRNFN